MSLPDQQNRAMQTFITNEIRGNYESANFFISWLNDECNLQVSGNAFFLEKKDGAIVIGNLFDESFNETEVPKQKFIDFIKANCGS